uniref:Macrophage-expressed gene 1 protein n=1 Tax=Neogobius melanostomus TaxID=47308 RepID=A0A8C6WJ64_9GOBI
MKPTRSHPLVLFFLFVLFLQTCTSLPIQPHNGLTHCQASRNLTALEVLPGSGWDNLRNMDMGRVMNLSYFQCQTTEDGLYLIPDEVFVIPQKETGVETSSEIISSWLEHKSVTSRSINADVSFFIVLNGKFSTENQRMKTQQIKYSAQTARVQVRDSLYIVKASPDFTLDSRFAQQVKDIAEAIDNDQMNNAAYLSEKMVLDYGTHVITTVDAGATLVQEDYLDSKYVSDNAQQGVSTEAEASFHFSTLFIFEDLKFGIGIKNSEQSSSHHTYESNIKDSNTESHGGVPFYPGMTLQKWQESTRNNLVAIDRLGVPLHHLINHNALPDLPQPTVEKVSQSLQNAIERYYEVNTRPGCVDVSSKNYNFQANVDDASCEGPATNLSFGGVYQQCEQLTLDAGPLCDKLAQRNPDTGNFSCRAPYTPTLLRSEEAEEDYSMYECHNQQKSCGPFGWSYCNVQVCENKHYNRSARINTYWCSVNGKAPDNSGYLFGGLYSPSMPNPITNSKGCPPNFTPVKFLSNGMMLCLSPDYETGSRYAVQFGGLFSCQSTNPLANGQRRCPPRFSQHLATVSDGCQILYCIQSKSFTGGELKPVSLVIVLEVILLLELVMVMTEGEKTWVRVGNAKLWKMAKPEEIQNMMKMTSNCKKTGVDFGALALLALVTTYEEIVAL